jgi:hypothetical protein
MVRTGSHAYVKYDFETSYGSGGSANKKFGLQDKLSSLSLTNNRMNLASLNQNTIHKFAYGQQQGTASMGFTLSSPWILGAILGVPAKTGSSSPFTYTYDGSASSSTIKTPRTIRMEVGLDAVDADILRTLKGGLVNNVSISTAVGGLVECTADITYGQEITSGSSISGGAPSDPSQEFPYTFAHAELQFGGRTVAQCQDVNLSLAQNSELLYGLNSHAAVASFRRVLDITGSFRASWVDKKLLEKLLAQVKSDSATTFQETVGSNLTQADGSGGSKAEFKISFIENATNQKIIITLTGLSITDQSISGIEPVEPIFEEINWQAKTISVVATSTLTAEP